jgi:2-(1,2-epoxy-1,2-dihydrophenyl)acetyl-CoA isomerase
MSSDLITYQAQQGIVTLTFNQPDNLNAMDEAMGKVFNEMMKKIQKDSSARVVILTGSGRAFSSGGNLDMIEGKMRKKPLQNKKELISFYKLFLTVRDLKVPVIAAINGHAIGAGFCLSLACDLRYAAESAKLGANFSKIGLAPGMGGTYLVTRLVGITRAAEILMLAENMPAQRAMELGLLNGVCKDEELMEKVQSIAKKISENAPLPLAYIKKGIQMAENSTLQKLFIYDSTAQAKCFASEDIKEGIKSIREKRAPLFKGK